MDRRRFLLAGSAVLLAGCSGNADSTGTKKPAADIDVEAYPELGVDRPSDRDERARQKKQVVDVAEALSRVDEVRDWLDQIEAEWNDR